MDEITAAIDVLRRGGLVGFPTETVYGLGADASNDAAVARLFEVKRRPPDHPVIVHIDSEQRLDGVAVGVTSTATRLAAAFWPGPLTLVLRRRPGAVSDRVTGGRDTVAVRVPDHPLALDLLARFGGGIAAPSANRFGRVSPTTAAHVRADLDRDVDLVLDGGPSAVGLESTIVDCSVGPPRILRIGAITTAQVESTIGETPQLANRGEAAAPGTLRSHYAPRAEIEIVHASDIASRVAANSARRVGVLALAGVASDVTGVTVLDPPRDVDEYAHVLYQRLRDADRAQLDLVLVVPPPADDIGAAVVDRLERAAAR